MTVLVRTLDPKAYRPEKLKWYLRSSSLTEKEMELGVINNINQFW
jgi:hypothetical protein